VAEAKILTRLRKLLALARSGNVHEAASRLARYEEPQEDIRCHTCDAPTKPDERARVVVCVRCGLQGGSPGSDG
jgi:hypothetical protein